MKALLTHNFYRYAGGEDHVYRDETWLLREHGHQVVNYELSNTAIDSMGKFSIARNTFWNDTTYREVRNLIQQEAPDLLHSTNAFPLMSPSLYAAANHEGLPVVQSLHNYRLFCPGSTLLRNNVICEKCVGKRFAVSAVIHRCYQESYIASAVSATMHAYQWLRGTWTESVTQFIALTNHSREKFIEAGLPEDRIAVKPNFLRLDPGFKSLKQNYAIFVGRLSPEKGISVLLDAWKTLAGELPLKIIGEGPLENEVATACSTLENVEYVGQQPFDKVLEMIGSARMLIFPSIWYETFGRSMIEAKAVGTPAIASNMGAMAELNTHMKTGLLFEPGKKDDLIAKVRMLLANPKLETSLALKGREQFEQNFTAKINLNLLLAIYQQAIFRSRSI